MGSMGERNKSILQKICGSSSDEEITHEIGFSHVQCFFSTLPLTHPRFEQA